MHSTQSAHTLVGLDLTCRGKRTTQCDVTLQGVMCMHAAMDTRCSHQTHVRPCSCQCSSSSGSTARHFAFRCAPSGWLESGGLFGGGGQCCRIWHSKLHQTGRDRLVISCCAYKASSLTSDVLGRRGLE